jgi:hypothetical protein
LLKSAPEQFHAFVGEGRLPLISGAAGVNVRPMRETGMGQSVATSVANRNGRTLMGPTKDSRIVHRVYTSVLDLHGQTVLPGLIDI